MSCSGKNPGWCHYQPYNTCLWTSKLEGSGVENAPQKAPGLCSGCSDERCPVKGRSLLPLRAVLGLCSRSCQLPLRACTFFGISYLSLSFMLHPKLSLLCKPGLCKPAEGQGLTQVMVGWVFSLFCFGDGTQVLSMLGKCFVT